MEIKIAFPCTTCAPASSEVFLQYLSKGWTKFYEQGTIGKVLVRGICRAFQQYRFHGQKWPAWWMKSSFWPILSYFRNITSGTSWISVIQAPLGSYKSVLFISKKSGVIRLTGCVSVKQVLQFAFWWLCRFRAKCSSDSLQHRALTNKWVMCNMKEVAHSSSGVQRS